MMTVLLFLLIVYVVIGLIVGVFYWIDAYVYSDEFGPWTRLWFAFVCGLVWPMLLVSNLKKR